MQGRIAVVVGEVEARHLESCCGCFNDQSCWSRLFLVCTRLQESTAVEHQHSLFRTVALQCLVVSRFGEAHRLEMVDVWL